MCRKKEAEFVLRYVDIDEAIRVNSEYKSDDFFDEIMIKREQKEKRMLWNMEYKQKDYFYGI